MADQVYVKAPSQEGEEMSVYFQSTKCDMETKTSKAGKTYKNFLYEVIVAGEEHVSILPIYEKNQQFIDQLSKFKPTKEDLCIIKTKMIRTKNGAEFQTLTLEIPSKGLTSDKGVQGGNYQGETREERMVKNVVIGVSWALELVYKANHNWFTVLDHEESTEEERILCEGYIEREVNKLLLLRDKIATKRINKQQTKHYETNQGSISGDQGQG